MAAVARLTRIRPELAVELGMVVVDPAVEDADHDACAGHGALRHFRQGDDPRSIHWKQTARTGEMVFMERESETSLRLSVQLDNGTDELASEVDRERFEQLVSEAATAAVDYLSRGYQVELVTRDGTLGYGTGWRHRLAILEALALVEPCTAAAEPLRGSDPQAPALRLGLDHPLGRAAWGEPEVA